ALGLLAGCRADEALNPPPTPAGGALFQRYVSMGNSITAGFQSAGINDSTQHESYAWLFARQVGASDFILPSLRGGQCSPLRNNVTQQKVETTPICFRTNPSVPYVSNVAVPGARVLEQITNIPGPPTFPPGT